MAYEDPHGLLARVDGKTRGRFVELARRFTKQTGYALRVRSGLRSCAEQAELYAIGRSVKLDSAPVTYARGCQSWHVLGRAIDADPVAHGQLASSCAIYTKAGEIWESLGGVWGGRFGGFGSCGDAGHFEYHPGLSLSTLCPQPAACTQAQAQIRTGGFEWPWALAGAALVVGVHAWQHRRT